MKNKYLLLFVGTVVTLAMVIPAEAARPQARSGGPGRSGHSSVRTVQRTTVSQSRYRPANQSSRRAVVPRGHRDSGVSVRVGVGGYQRPYYRSSHYYRPGRVYHYPSHRVYYSHWPYYRRVYVTGPIPPVVVHRPVVIHEPSTIDVGATVVQVSRQQQLIDTVLRDSTDDRRRAARELAEFDNISSVAVLVDVLVNDSSSEVRAAAAKSLGEIGDPAAFELLLRSAELDPADRVREQADQAAEEIQKAAGDEELYVSPSVAPMNYGREKLGEYLQDLRFGRSDIRKRAADKLDDYPGTQSVAALINILINDSNDDVREEAAESLGKIGDRAALPFLELAKYNDPSKSVRKDAEKAIEKIYNTIL